MPAMQGPEGAHVLFLNLSSSWGLLSWLCAFIGFPGTGRLDPLPGFVSFRLSMDAREMEKVDLIFHRCPP
jgi:hypothetical protein